MALRYRIWAYCEPRGWDCTTSEVAEALGEVHKRVSRTCAAAGWMERLRAVDRWQPIAMKNGWNIRNTDDALEGRWL